ncbi:hypothetical protein, partial [Pantoea agglomerans]|uniref:hypothetical protein n=1 Tax=Enterobacter agglomerans TaxID=549 RepID=UPI001A8E2A86
LPQALLKQQITLDKIAYESSAAVRSAQSKQEAARERVRQACRGRVFIRQRTINRLCCRRDRRSTVQPGWLRLHPQ